MSHKIYNIQLTEHYTPKGNIGHLKIRRCDGKEIKVRWDTLQKIKNEVVGEDTFAVEFFPEEGEVVNEVNMRHLWIIPREWLPFGLGQ